MITGVVILSGMLIVAGSWALIAAATPVTPHLAATLVALDGDAAHTVMAEEPAPSAGRSERLGTWLYRHSPVPLTQAQRRSLQIRNKTIAEFYADKAILAMVGAILPSLVTAFWAFVVDLPASAPVLAGLLGLLAGYFAPDLMLRGTASAVREDATEALLSYIDLVTLERLANASATQALHNAAQLSDIGLFTQLRAALERARLEQQTPFRELRRLAEQLGLPELGDLADVMQLEESGAALSGALRARVRELRDAHLSRAQLQAQATAEGMTLYMTIPALIFGVIFVVPPLMRIIGG